MTRTLLCLVVCSVACDGDGLDASDDPGCETEGACIPCELADTCECIGDLYVTIALEPPPTMRVIWDGAVVLDECADLDTEALRVTRLAGGIELLISGPRYAPREHISIEIVDTKDCIADAEVGFSVVDEPLDGAPFERCEAARVAF